ncbi:DMT family transporter [Mesorhizobium sp. BAC0120]|uniref:DMT family transporter n=1 Tax=Mesorhizobium sp. BAC0120 TaxID=3090670 RepID=UPI00298D31C2|nr:DMT family transporter [Mesorhizobium sp. BAC0120]MDW6025144.1 DMT family transporter [Mesorhizobium sp. BAC0120]
MDCSLPRAYTPLMSAEAATAIPSKAMTSRPFEPLDYGLYALTVLSWSASWFAIKLQVDVVSPEVNIVWRFAIASILMFAWVLVSGRRLTFPLSDHLRFVTLGVLMFSSNFLLFYYGALHLVSGLLSVVFSLASVVNMLLAALITREPPSLRVLVGGLAGFLGIALMFYPEMARHGLNGDTLTGLLLCVGGTLSFCLGNQVSAYNQRRGLPIVSVNAWGMLYGTIWSGFLAFVLGKPFMIEPTVSYFGSLIFLAVVSTVIAFAAYLTLLGRIGTARAGYSTVMFPIFALLISTAFEGYSWTAYAVAGLALVGLGNVLVIGTGKR